MTHDANGVSTQGDYGKNLSDAYQAKHGWSGDLNDVYQHQLDASIKDFTKTYGGPRDHAAEQRSFNSGKREINRLRKQGK